MSPFLRQLGATLGLLIVALTLYHRLLVRPAQQIGVVDVGSVYRAKEAQFARVLATGGSEEERQAALALAAHFAQRLPVALDELAHDCRCLVVMKSAFIGAPERTVDLTAHLMHKVER